MAKWTDNLPSAVYNRLCDCVNTKDDVPVLINARWKWMQDNKKPGTKEDALVYVFELLDSNSQDDLCDVSRSEYMELCADVNGVKKAGITAADFKIAKRYAKAAADDAQEVNALFKYDNPSMVDLNKGRLLVTIQEAINSLEMLEKLLIRGQVSESVAKGILNGNPVRKEIEKVLESDGDGDKTVLILRNSFGMEIAEIVVDDNTSIEKALIDAIKYEWKVDLGDTISIETRWVEESKRCGKVSRVNEGSIKGKRDPYKVNIISKALDAMKSDAYYLTRLKPDSEKAINVDVNVLEILKAYYNGKQVIVAQTEFSEAKRLTESTAKIKEAFAEYTGGGIWLFWGKLSDGTYFLTDDYGATLILNESPEDFDESLYVEWQDEHKIKELMGKERLVFCDSLVDWLKSADSNHQGGITDEELDHYRKYFRELR